MVCACKGFVLLGLFMYRFCDVCLCVCKGFVRVGVCMYGFCNLWLCVCMVLVVCACVNVWHL